MVSKKKKMFIKYKLYQLLPSRRIMTLALKKINTIFSDQSTKHNEYNTI